MQDIDDFDPLDDILLSDDEAHDGKNKPNSVLGFLQKHKGTEEISKDEKKKKMLEELFGTTEETVREPPAESFKKVDEPSKPVANIPEKVELDDEPKSKLKSDWLMEDSKLKVDDSSKKLSSSASDGRRRSEFVSTSTDLIASKQRYKSLELDSEANYEFSVSPKKSTTAKQSEPVKETNSLTDSKIIAHKEVSEKLDTIKMYTPSVGTNRRPGSTKKRSFIFDDDELNLIETVQSKDPGPTTKTDSLPSWLDSKAGDDKPVVDAVKQMKKEKQTESLDFQDKNDNVSSASLIFNNLEPKNVKPSMEKNDEYIISDSFPEPSAISSIAELKRKCDELRNLAKSSANLLSNEEQKLQNSAVKLIQQQRSNISALLEVINTAAPDNRINISSMDENEKSVIESLKHINSQLQVKIKESEMINIELEMKIKQIEATSSAELSMLENIYKYKLRLAEEREAHLQKQLEFVEKDFENKITKQKENENELIRSYKEKVELLQEEQRNELKHAAELCRLKIPIEEIRPRGKPEVLEVFQQMPDKELTAKSLALEEKHKHILELQEEVNRQKTSLEGKKESLKIKEEEFEKKYLKEKLELKQQRKDLKLVQSVFEEKAKSWEKEKERDKEYISNYKKELEALQENLMKEGQKLIKEKFAIATQKAQFEAVSASEGFSSGNIADVIRTKAQLQGAVEEINRTKSKLEAERNDLESEKIRLKEENWRLKSLEQQLVLRDKHFEYAMKDAEKKREEGMNALRKAEKIDSELNGKAKEIQRKLVEIQRKEEQLVKEKIEISTERELLNKRKNQLDVFLPQLTATEQLPFTILNKNILDPKMIMMKLNLDRNVETKFASWSK